MIVLLIYIAVTFLFFIARYFFDPKYYRIMIGIFATLVLFTQFYFNLKLISTVCKGNKSNFFQALLNTVIPWMVIGGGVILALKVFPGWKRPFSNTFGYGVARLAGVNTLLFKLLKSSDSGGIKLKKTLHDIYTNPSLFINQINLENFDDFVRESQFMFVPGAAKMPEMTQFKNIIYMKELVSEFIWTILTGILVTTVSYNRVINASCNNSVKEMKKRHDEYEEAVKKNAEEKAKAPPQRVYKIYD